MSQRIRGASSLQCNDQRNKPKQAEVEWVTTIENIDTMKPKANNEHESEIHLLKLTR